MNARWLEFTGRPAAAELGCGWTDRIHPEDRDATGPSSGQAVDAAAAASASSAGCSATTASTAGCWTKACRVSAPAAASWASSGWRTDITDRRQLEQRLVRAERAQAIGQLAGGVAHDFNNLLTGIIGHVGLLQEEPGLSDLAREDLAQIQRSADRAASLTRQLLAFSRRQVLAPRVLDLNEVVAGCLSTLRRLVGERIQVVSVPAASLDPIVADPNQLEQILSQLSAYARDSMPERGHARAAAPGRSGWTMIETGRLQGLRAGSYVALQVRDTGRGLDPATLERIFEPFFGPGPAGDASGLGLASVYGIVKQSGGHIDVASEPGAGTSFTIYFPPPRGQRAGRRLRAGDHRRHRDDPARRRRGAGPRPRPPGARAGRLHGADRGGRRVRHGDCRPPRRAHSPAGHRHAAAAG